MFPAAFDSPMKPFPLPRRLSRSIDRDFDIFGGACFSGVADPLNDGAFLSLLDPVDLLGDPCCDEDDFDMPADENLFFRHMSKEPLKHPKWNDDSEDEAEAEEGASDGGAGAFRRSGRLAARTTTGSSARRSAAAPTGTRETGNSSSDNEVEQPTPSSGRSVGALLHPDDGKDRSLGLLCERFLAEYCGGTYGVELSLDDAAARLCVERRRIYDIVNIFESLDIVKRKGKNKYLWLGVHGLTDSLETLRVRAMAVREERIARIGETPRTDCYISLDAPSSAKELFESPSRITVDMSPVNLSIAVPPSPVVVETAPSPARTRYSPFRASPNCRPKSIVRATAAELRRQTSDSSAPPTPDPTGVFQFSALSACADEASEALPPPPALFSPVALGPKFNLGYAPPSSDAAPKVTAQLGVIVAEDLACSAPTRSVVPRREKSLGTLCQKFISIFLLGKSCFCLDDAAKLLMMRDEMDGPAKLRTKIRRLYDIANVLCTIGLVEKVMSSQQKKPGFRWRGAPAVQQFMESCKKKRSAPPSSSRADMPMKRHHAKA